MSEWSRHSKYSFNKLPKEKYTHSMRGGGVRGWNYDGNRYYRCWHCRFVCDIQRDTLDYSDHSKSGVTVTSVTIDGETVYYPQITGGCPFCGTKVWKG